MNEEDYFKYYIQGSDHYLIPKDVFIELFQEMNNWKDTAKASEKARKEAIKYINVTEYSGIVGLNKNGIKEFWFVKDILKILDIDKGE